MTDPIHVAIFGSSVEVKSKVANMLMKSKKFWPSKHQSKLVIKSCVERTGCVTWTILVGVGPDVSVRPPTEIQTETIKTSILSKRLRIIVLVQTTETATSDRKTEEWINAQFGPTTKRLHVLYIPGQFETQPKTIRKQLIADVRAAIVPDSGNVGGSNRFKRVLKSKENTTTNNDLRKEENDLPLLATSPGHAEQNLYRDTLRDGKAPSNCISVIVVGNENAGKTTLIRRLISLENPSAINDNSCTTSCLVDYEKETRTWEVEKKDFLEEMNVQRMSQAMATVRENQPAKTRNLKENEDNSGRDADAQFGSDCIEDDEPRRTFNYEAASSSSEKYKYLTDVVARVNRSQKPKIFFTYREYGGLDTNVLSYQAFLPQRAVYLLVVDLSLDFYRKMSTSMNENNTNCKCLLKEYTVLEMIRFWTSSIKKGARETEDNHSAPMILVATRKDKLSSTHANIKIGQIREELMMFGVDDLNVILVDTRNCPVQQLEQLRNHVFDNSRAFCEKDIPAQWIELEHKLVLLKQSKAFCSIGEFNNIVLQSDVPVTNKSEIKRFLDFQQDSGQIIYIDTGKDNCSILLNPMVLRLYIRTLWKLGQNRLNLMQNDVIRMSAVERAHELVEEHLNASCDIEVILVLLEHLNIMIRVSITDKEQGFILPSLLKRASSETKTECISEKAPTIQIKFREWHTHPAVYYEFLFSLLKHVKCSRSTDHFYLLSRIYLNGDTVYCDTQWMQLAIYIRLKNLSPTRRIRDLNCRYLLSMVKNAVRESFHQHSHESIHINIECDQHEMRFVNLKVLEEEGEARCETVSHVHAVSRTIIGVYESTTSKQTIIQAPQFPAEETRTPNGRNLSDRDLGRLARRLTREDGTLGFARLLGIEDLTPDVNRINTDFEDIAERRMELLRLWYQRDPPRTVRDLEILTKEESYSRDHIVDILESEVVKPYYLEPDTLLDAVPSDASLSTVCDYMSGNYPFVFLELGLSWQEIKVSKQRCAQFHLRFHNLLVKWKKKFHEKATLRLLLDTLRFFKYDTDTVLSVLRRS